MNLTDHQHGQDSHNTNAIELYVSILDLKIKSNSGPAYEKEISIYFKNKNYNCTDILLSHTGSFSHNYTGFPCFTP